ncbi:MAG: acyltransferase [Clostridia bacterium]|nr:acyltransferase [Clostridia bacterium]
MNAKRLWHTIRLMTKRGARSRAEYLKRKQIFAHVGENCSFMQRSIPLYPELIRFGDNVHTASNVNFATHDITHMVVNHVLEKQGRKERVNEKIGCIDIGSDVFIGAGVRILYDVKIGSRVIIGAGALVTRDIPDNSIAVGVPAHVIGTFDDYIEKRLEEKKWPDGLAPSGQQVSKALQDWLWADFKARHNAGRDDRG